MDSLLKSVSSSKTETADAAHTPSHDQPAPTTSELFSSAKVVADAAKAKFSNQEFDQPKAAGAAADLLNAASHYGKLEEDKGLGKMLDKAEDYLHQYSHKTTTTTTTTATATTTPHETGEHGHSAGGAGGGYGDYVNMAEGFLKKQSGDHSTTSHGGSATGGHSEGGHDDSGGGLGDYMKMAGDFLKKN